MYKCDFYKRFVSNLEMESMKWKHFIYFELQILTQLCTGIYIVSIYAYFEFQLLQTHTHLFPDISYQNLWRCIWKCFK